MSERPVVAAEILAGAAILVISLARILVGEPVRPPVAGELAKRASANALPTAVRAFSVSERAKRGH